ncbi:hypothetical protein [Acidocella sp.]|uniref:hypothetical protein n=1 Tax=Acidocella sp. TaxID=50710 RepID=UPI00262F3846|nr:hypothetical protein [Acidocella sp.]
MTKFAILFKTHFWDEFTARQLQRLREHSGAGAVIAVIDETMVVVPETAAPREIRIGMDDLVALQLPLVTTHGSIIWYNTDYPNYVAFQRLEPFDYYVCIEYDACVTLDIELLVDGLARGGVDYLGFPIRKSCRDWPWYEMHRASYGDEMLVYLSCMAVFSHRAMALLLRRRQEMGRLFAGGQLEFWPNNEAFIPNELRNGGMKLVSLGAYGDVSNYDWWPPCDEAELAKMQSGAFIHPVLAGMRYARSVVHHEPSLWSFVNPASALHGRLRAVPVHARNRLLRQEFMRRLQQFTVRRLAAVGLKRKWYERAQTGKVGSPQTQSAHNSAS